MFRSKCRRYKDAYINYSPIIDIKTQDFEFFTRQMMKPNFHFKDKITQDPSPKSTLTTTEFSVPKKTWSVIPVKVMIHVHRLIGQAIAALLIFSSNDSSSSSSLARADKNSPGTTSQLIQIPVDVIWRQLTWDKTSGSFNSATRCTSSVGGVSKSSGHGKVGCTMNKPICYKICRSNYWAELKEEEKDIL